jgi:hypothetical protein
MDLPMSLPERGVVLEDFSGIGKPRKPAVSGSKL